MDRPGATPAVFDFRRSTGKEGLAGPIVLAAGTLAAGSVLVLVALTVARDRPEIRPLASVIGGAATVAGPLIALVGLLRRARGEASLALRSDGVVLSCAGAETQVPWGSIREVRFEAPSRIVLERDDADPLVIDHGFRDPQALAKRIDELRRKAAFGLLRASNRKAPFRTP